MRSSARWAIALSCALLAGAAGAATPGDNVGVVRDLASRVGPIVGSALACPDITHPRIQAIADKFRAVIREVSTNEAERDDISRLFDRYVNDGRGSVTAGRVDCKSADRQLTDLETIDFGPVARVRDRAVVGQRRAGADRFSRATARAPAAQTTVALATPHGRSFRAARHPAGGARRHRQGNPLRHRRRRSPAPRASSDGR